MSRAVSGRKPGVYLVTANYMEKKLFDICPPEDVSINRNKNYN